MDDYRIISGKYSIVLGSSHYSNIFNTQPKKLIKITKKDSRHDETKYNSIITQIKDYENYYYLIESEKEILFPSSKIFNYLKTHDIDNICKNILYSSNLLYYYLIDNLGDMDLYMSLQNSPNNKYSNIWKKKTPKKFKIFIIHILKGLYYLHDNKICHFDIKPENIIINSYLNNKIKNFHLKFKIIDFGYADKEPFKKYLKYKYGTPGYSTINYPLKYYDNYLPYIETNDWKNNVHISKRYCNYQIFSIYKTDVFAFGKTLYFMCKIFEINNLINEHNCCSNNKKNLHIINDIKYLIDNMIKGNIEDRWMIIDCINYIK